MCAHMKTQSYEMNCEGHIKATSTQVIYICDVHVDAAKRKGDNGVLTQ